MSDYDYQRDVAAEGQRAIRVWHRDELPPAPPTPEAVEFDQWYVTHVFDYGAAPIGSRDYALQKKAWFAARGAKA